MIVNYSPRLRRHWKSLLHLSRLAGLVTATAAAVVTVSAAPILTGELKKWHKITLTFEGPETGELADPNPFLYYRLNVVFTHPASQTSYPVPGYYAADGDAANSSADSGNKWRVHFSPDHTGVWNYQVSFRQGEFISVTEKPEAGESVDPLDGLTGSFEIGSSDKSSRDFRAEGRLEYVGKHHLQFAGSKKFFLKFGADAPENLLAYSDFDGEFRTDGRKDELIKSWEPHLKDWKEGDPTWQEGKGKGLVGALNYLASKGMNVFSFLTLNIAGDDENVYPYINYETFDRFDVSKLDQWEIIFEHADRLGLYLHFKTQEAENQGLLDGGGVGVERKLYYRELIARYSHHLALNWNLGEENGTWGRRHRTPPQDSWQRRAMARYFYEHDPYKHLIVVHNGQPFDDLLGDQSDLTGASVQTNKPDFINVYPRVLEWINKSKQAGKPWVVACDEPGDAQHSLLPDAEDPRHDEARKNALWGALMAGGAGIEWYFGYRHDHSDLTCQDWRSRDRMWDQSRYALEFFEQHEIPFWSMAASNHLSASGDWVLAGKNDGRRWVMVVFVKEGTDTHVKLPSGVFDYGWYNPRQGGSLTGEGQASGPEEKAFRLPGSQDWVLLLSQTARH